VDSGHAHRGGPGGRHPDRPQPGPPHLPRRAGPLAPDADLGEQHGPGVRPKRTRIVALHTCLPAGATVLDADELGPVIPRTFPRHRAGRRTGAASRPRWSTVAATRRSGCTARCASGTARRSPSPPRPATRPATCACSRNSPAPTDAVPST
jgi:hypothetical protein